MKGKKIAAAVSGGADSMVMLDMMLKEGIKPFVINFEHGIRGEESVIDSEFVAKKAAEYGLECRVVALDAPGYSAARGIGVEEAARELRYREFDRMLAAGEADAIALAHHMDDNAETILMRLFRGTGVKGLTGIADRPGFVHPLADLTRAEIEEYARENSKEFRTDSTNSDSGYTRNFIRLKLVPTIRERFPGFERRLKRLSEAALEIDSLLEELKTEAVPVKGGYELKDEAFERPIAVVKRSIADAVRKLGITRDMEAANFEDVIALYKSEVGKKVSLPFGTEAHRESRSVVFMRPFEADDAEYPFEIGGKYRFFGTDYSFAKVSEVQKGCFDAGKVPSDAVVRLMRGGDRFRRYKGGDKSLGDYFTDVKYPVRLRKATPVLASGSRVLLIFGSEVSDELKVDENTKYIYICKEGEQ